MPNPLSGYIRLLRKTAGKITGKIIEQAKALSKSGKIKKVEILSQYFDPTSTYEKQPFEKGNNIYSNEMPNDKLTLIRLKNSFLILLKR